MAEFVWQNVLLKGTQLGLESPSRLSRAGRLRYQLLVAMLCGNQWAKMNMES